MKVIFMGTPDFSVGTLEALIKAGHDVVLAVTQPDKPKGRGKEMQYTPVKECALKYNIPVYQPRRVRESECIEELRKYEADIMVVVAFGQILPKEILEMTRYGCVNVHASLLPKYRGAAPIQWSIIDGEEVTGVTTMQMNEGLDTGDILLVEKTKIGENETSGDLYERLTVLGAGVLIKTLEAIKNNSLNPQKQDDGKSSYAKMLDKSLSKIDWNLSAQEVHNKIRGLDPWPVALTSFDGKNLKLFRSKLLNEEYIESAGTVLKSKDGIVVVCGDKKAVLITEVQLEGKKRMKMVGNVEIPQEAFLAVLKIDE